MGPLYKGPGGSEERDDPYYNDPHEYFKFNEAHCDEMYEKNCDEEEKTDEMCEACGERHDEMSECGVAHGRTSVFGESTDPVIDILSQFQSDEEIEQGEQMSESDDDEVIAKTIADFEPETASVEEMSESDEDVIAALGELEVEDMASPEGEEVSLKEFKNIVRQITVEEKAKVLKEFMGVFGDKKRRQINNLKCLERRALKCWAIWNYGAFRALGRHFAEGTTLILDSFLTSFKKKKNTRT